MPPLGSRQERGFHPPMRKERRRHTGTPAWAPYRPKRAALWAAGMSGEAHAAGISLGESTELSSNGCEKSALMQPALTAVMPSLAAGSACKRSRTESEIGGAANRRVWSVCARAGAKSTGHTSHAARTQVDGWRTAENSHTSSRQQRTSTPWHVLLHPGPIDESGMTRRAVDVRRA